MEIRPLAFGEFTKAEDADDGSLLVEGICSSGSVDTQGDRILPSAMKAAIGPFLRGFPAIREQHDPMKAAGTALAMEVDSQGRTWIRAKILDESTIRKVTSRPPVLRGWSIAGSIPPGGRDPDDPSTVRTVVLREVSLVDSPACRDAVVTMFKIDDPGPDADADEQISKLAARLDGALSKVAGLERERDEALAKAAALGRRVQKVMGERDAARSRLAKAALAHAADVGRLTAERDRYFAAAAAKGSLRAVAISKAEDNGSAPARPPEPEDVHALIKVAQRRPAVLFDRPSGRAR